MNNFRIKNFLQLKNTLSFVWQNAKILTVANSFLLILQGVIPLFSLYLLKLLIDTITKSAIVSDKLVAFQNIFILIMAMGLITIIGTVLNSLSAFVSEWQGIVITDKINKLLHAKSIEVDLEYYENSKYHDTLQRAQLEAPYRPLKIVNGVTKVIQNGISIFAIAGLLIYLNWLVALIVLIAVIPGVITKFRFAKKNYQLQRDQTAKERKSNYLNWLLTSSQHAKEIRLFNLGSLFIERFQQIRKEIRLGKLKIITWRFAAEIMTQIFANLAIFCSYTYIVYCTVMKTLTLGDLIMYFQAFQKGQSFVQDFLGGIASLYEDNLFIANFYEFLELQSKIKNSITDKQFPKVMKKGIVFENVSFQYPGCDHKVLNNISFKIRPGEVIALVGENGAGKTTLIKLLSRLYEPTNGKILVDGVNLNEFDLIKLREQITVIFQDYVQYHFSARENIWLGNIKFDPDHERILWAAKNSGADKIIQNLPNSYESILGRWFEKGQELSIGEWQKIALARAFLRDSQIIILDEPTSSLDVKSEFKVFQNFKKLAEGKTAIIISHRFSTVKMANRILVLNNGSICEMGTHEELINLQGIYAGMFELQASSYK
ncbi:MAG: ABC transporter ATP-binding protein [Candidatus Margulisiibacteriota bacterium]|jgi:ATP-binding cassette subfamily B protein